MACVAVRSTSTRIFRGLRPEIEGEAYKTLEAKRERAVDMVG